MRSLLLIVCILFNAFLVKSQISSDASAFPDYTNSFSLNLPGLLFRSINFQVDHKIKDANYLEFTAGYRFQWQTDNSKILFIPLEDPFWFYSIMSCSIGINHYYNKHFYIGPFLQYQYRHFNKIRFTDYLDYTGDMADEDWIISRFKNEAGMYFKLGYSHTWGKMLNYNLYFDLGLNCAYNVEKVSAREGWNGPIPGDYPITTKKITYPLGINMGFAIGFVK
jgi:hypothetical protein